MRGEEGAERLLLEAEQLPLVKLLRPDRCMVPRRRAGLLRSAPEVEDRGLAQARVLLGLLAEGDRGGQDLQHPLSGGAGRVERSTFDEALHGALVDGTRVNLLTEVPERGELPTLLARVEDGLDR